MNSSDTVTIHNPHTSKSGNMDMEMLPNIAVSIIILFQSVFLCDQIDDLAELLGVDCKNVKIQISSHSLNASGPTPGN